MTKNKNLETTLCALVIAILMVACGKAETSIPQSTIVSVTDAPTETPSPTSSPTFTPTSSPTFTPSLTPTETASPTPTDTPTSTPSPTPENLFDDAMYDFMECIHYNPETLEIEDLGDQGYRLVDGDGVVVVPFLDDMGDANQALQLATLYKQNCVVGDKGNNSFRWFQFWQESSGLDSNLVDIDCPYYDQSKLWVKNFDDYGYGIMSTLPGRDGNYVIGLTKQEAEFGVQEIFPKFDYFCFIGRVNNDREKSRDYITTYLRTEDNFNKP